MECNYEELEEYIAPTDGGNNMYLHQIKLLNDNKDTVIAWVSVINNMEYFTNNDFIKYLKENNYTDLYNPYFFAGGGSPKIYQIRNSSNNWVDFGSPLTGFFVEDETLHAKHSFFNDEIITDLERVEVETFSLFGKNYLHEIRFLNQGLNSVSYWAMVISDSPSMSPDDFSQFLHDNGYDSPKNAYCLGVGGSPYRLTLRSTTGNVNCNVPCTGFYTLDGNSITVKYAEEGTLVINASRIRVNTIPLIDGFNPDSINDFYNYIHHIKQNTTSDSIIASSVIVIGRDPVFTADDFKQFLDENDCTDNVNAYVLCGGGCTYTYTFNTRYDGNAQIACPFTGFLVDGNQLKIKYNFDNILNVPNETTHVESRGFLTWNYVKHYLGDN